MCLSFMYINILIWGLDSNFTVHWIDKGHFKIFQMALKIKLSVKLMRQKISLFIFNNYYAP